MERLIIIALVLLWFVITFIAGYVMEAAVAAIKKQRKQNRARTSARRNTAFYSSDMERRYTRIITEP